MRVAKDNPVRADKVIRWLMDDTGTTLSDIARYRGVSRPSVYKNLSSPEITLEVFTQLVEACGYKVLVAKVEGGKAVGMRSVRWFSKEGIDG